MMKNKALPTKKLSFGLAKQCSGMAVKSPVFKISESEREMMLIAEKAVAKWDEEMDVYTAKHQKRWARDMERDRLMLSKFDVETEKLLAELEQAAVGRIQELAAAAESEEEDEWISSDEEELAMDEAEARGNLRRDRWGIHGMMPKARRDPWSR